jgi:hypothetical protein
MLVVDHHHFSFSPDSEFLILSFFLSSNRIAMSRAATESDRWIWCDWWQRIEMLIYTDADVAMPAKVAI